MPGTETGAGSLLYFQSWAMADSTMCAVGVSMIDRLVITTTEPVIVQTGKDVVERPTRP
jgi:hypothetical protein